MYLLFLQDLEKKFVRVLAVEIDNKNDVKR